MKECPVCGEDGSLWDYDSGWVRGEDLGNYHLVRDIADLEMYKAVIDDLADALLGLPAKETSDCECKDCVEKNFPIPAKEVCPHCGELKSIRNPSGYCDHLYYPENCEVCKTGTIKKEVLPQEEGNKMIDFTQRVENYLDDFTDKEGCSFISEDEVDRIKWAVTTIAEEVLGYDKLGTKLPQGGITKEEIEEIVTQEVKKYYVLKCLNHFDTGTLGIKIAQAIFDRLNKEGGVV